MEALAPLLITFGLMWLLLIRPQQRRVRQHQAVVSSLEPGDDVITAGGIHGTIVSVDDETLRVEVSPGVVLRILRGAVSQRVATVDPVADDSTTDDVTTGDVTTGDVTTVTTDDEK